MADQWRCPVKFVAWFDMITTIFGLAYGIAIGVTYHQEIQEVMGKVSAEKEYRLKVAIIVIWTAVAIAILLSFLLFWASVRLLNSTDPRKDPSQARKMARTWLIITAICLLLTVSGSVYQRNFVGLGVGAAIRGGFMIIVYKFMEELEEDAKQQENAAAAKYSTTQENSSCGTNKPEPA